MFRKKDSLAILTIFSIFASFDVASSIIHKNKVHTLTYGEFIQDIDFFTNPGLVYGSCHDIETHEDNFKANCTFVMETNKRVDSEEHLRFCDYKLNMKVNHNENLQLKRVVALNQDMAVAIFESYDTFRYFVLHFNDPCRGFSVDVDGNLKAMVYAPQYDRFQLVSTERHRQCEDDRRCRLIMNMQGRIHEVSYRWLHYDEGQLVAITSATHGEQLVIDKHEDSVRLYIADSAGMIQILKEYKTHERDEDRVLGSMTYGYASLCSKNENTLICSQFDLDGHIIFEKEIMLLQFSILNVYRLHNLPNGGLLLVMASCVIGYLDLCVEDLDHFYVTRIYSLGTRVRTIKVEKPARVSIDKLHLYQNEERNLCLSHVSNDWRSVDTTDVDVFCFTEEDFNKIQEFKNLH